MQPRIHFSFGPYSRFPLTTIFKLAKGSPYLNSLAASLVNFLVLSAVMHDSDSGIRIDSGMIPLLVGIGIVTLHSEKSNSWNAVINALMIVFVAS